MQGGQSTRGLGPDFFLVGAPKCGTTALNAYLAEHPRVYMGPKERHFFGSDLDEIWNYPPGISSRPTAEKYFGAFAGTEWAARRGEASVWYLWSRCAAREIHEYDPGAQIIVMLRNPADMLASLHSQLLHQQIEVIDDFEEAFEAEQDRRAGRRIPPFNSATYPWRLLYRDIPRFHEQLDRYFAVFDREQIHVVLYDDFAKDTQAAYEGVLSFLGVEMFAPELRPVNQNKAIRSRALQRLVWQIMDSSSPLRRAGTRMIPSHRVRSALLREVPGALKRLNNVTVPRPPVPATVKAQLAAELADDVHRLEELLDRDLSHWLDGAASLEGMAA